MLTLTPKNIGNNRVGPPYHSIEIHQFALILYPIGAGFGLQLTLNIEQYEYIQGPSTDAGIKVCARNPCRKCKTSRMSNAMSSRDTGYKGKVSRVYLEVKHRCFHKANVSRIRQQISTDQRFKVFMIPQSFLV